MYNTINKKEKKFEKKMYIHIRTPVSSGDHAMPVFVPKPFAASEERC